MLSSEQLALQCVNDIPEKQLGLGYLELAKFYELKGEFDKSEKILFHSMEKF